LSATVQVIAGGIFEEAEADEKEAEECPEVSGDAPEETEATISIEAETFSIESDISPDDGEVFSSAEVDLSEGEVQFAVAEDAVADDMEPEQGAGGEHDRAVDWMDDVFDLPITGTIHGVGDEDAIEVWIDDSQTIRAAMQGKVRFSSNGRRIKSISRGGFLAIKEEHGTTWKELDVVRGDKGGLKYAYFVDGNRREFEGEGRAWLADVLAEMFPYLPAKTGLAPLVPLGRGTKLDKSLLPPMPAVSPGPRIGRPSLLGRVVDWASSPFNMDGKGLIISTEDDGEMSILWSDGRDRLKVKMDGKVRFSDDDRSIKSISRRGYLAIQEKRGGYEREVSVEPDHDGILEYDYYEEGKRREFDPDAQEWLADVLIDVIRNTGIGAEARAQRILDERGVAGLLAEIDEIESDYVQRTYFSAALDSEDLTTDQYAEILSAVEKNVDSDYEKAEILIDMADRVSENSTLIEAYVDVVATIDSDYETRRALSAVSIGNNVDATVIDAVLEIAADMDSDYEKAELLIEMAPYCLARRTLQQSYVDAVVDVDSDYEARRILTALSLEGEVAPNIVQTVLGIASRFDSDYEMAELLTDMAPYIAEHPGVQDTYLGAVSRIDSDYETKRTLKGFIDVAEMTDNRILAILEVVRSMGSSYEQSEVLKDLVDYCRGNDTLEDAFLDVVESLDSDYEIDQLYRHLYRRDRHTRGER
jgi:hypothetical protein